jgi:hypothetical protein
MNPADFSNVASGIESIALTIAIVVGGVWALYRFGALRAIEKAKADLEATQRKLRERGILNITMEATQLTGQGTSDRRIVVNVTVKNDGNRSEVINWAASFVRVTQVVASREAEALAYGQSLNLLYSTPDGPSISSSVMPAQVRTFPFLALVDGPGTYHLQFVAKVSPAEATISEAEHRAAGTPADEFIWQSASYITVV